jgi:3',5'-cyclic AMP phosphodiesterase CpdA
MPQEWNLLSVTDLHYADRNANFKDDDKFGTPFVFREEVFGQFHHILDHGFNDRKFDLIAVPGDLTTHGKSEGFERFVKNTADRLVALLASGKPQGLCLVPGNHDVRWELESSDKDYFDKKFADYRDAVNKIHATSCLVPTGPVPDSPDAFVPLQTVSSDPPLLIDDDRNIIALCINSSMRCGEINVDLRNKLRTRVDAAENNVDAVYKSMQKGAPGRAGLYGGLEELGAWKEELNHRLVFDVPHVTSAQIQALGVRLSEAIEPRRNGWSSYLKVAILHHHLLPFPRQVTEHKPFELLADASKVLALLTDFDFDLVLTGHKHQRYLLPFRDAGKRLLIVGGPTIGGYPTEPPGFRHIHVRKTGLDTEFAVADLPLDMSNDLKKDIDERFQTAKRVVFSEESKPTIKPLYPQVIEDAIHNQLYARPFYKTNVQFVVQIEEVGEDRITLCTVLSYQVTNRTEQTAEWRIKYDFTRADGEVLELKVNDKPLTRGHLTQVDIPYRLLTNETIRVYCKVREAYSVQDDEFYTSYNPASDLRVVLEGTADGLAFEMEKIADGDAVKFTVNGAPSEVHISNGLLPYQGVKVSWSRRSI